MQELKVAQPQKAILETDWAYLAGLIDGEGFLDIFLHSNPSIRKTCKRGYSREFKLLIQNSNLAILKFIQELVASVAKSVICTHKPKPPRLQKVNSYSLRFYHNSIRIILPKLIPYFILKKELAEIIVKELAIISNELPSDKREHTLLSLDRKFRETARASEGSKRWKVRNDDRILYPERFT